MLPVKVKAGVIDAGAHVVENERVWDYLGPSEEKYLFSPSTGENKRGGAWFCLKHALIPPSPVNGEEFSSGLL